MIKFIKKSSIIIYIDYFIIILISQKINFIILNINKLNLRLMRAFQYLSMFNLFIRHKTKKTNVVFDTLLRLSGNLTIISKNDSKILKTLYKQTMKIIK